MFNWFKKKEISTTEREKQPDFSKITTISKAVDLSKKGQLVKVHLIALEFGGEDSERNILYVPEFAQIIKHRFDKMIEELLIDGKKLGYSAEPEYKGNSVIPSKLKMTVTGESEFKETINIW